jgi:hypothetical protein
VGEVKQTQIFAGLVFTDMMLQFTVYKNSVANKQSNAMILPFPIPDRAVSDKDPSYAKINNNKDVIQFVDMREYEKDHAPFFDRLSWAFPRKIIRTGFVSSDATSLEVKKIGGYSVSVARNIHFLEMMDRKVFQINPIVLKLLKEKYHSMGFVICKFDKSIEQNSFPIGYVHQIDKQDKYFVPAFHFHGGKEVEDVSHDWDHIIYFANAKKAIPGDFLIQKNPFIKGEIDALNEMLGGEILIDSVARLRVNGLAPNQDFWLSFDKELLE